MKASVHSVLYSYTSLLNCVPLHPRDYLYLNQFTGRMLQKTTLLKKIISSIVIIASFVYICLATEQRSNIIVLLCGL